MKSPVHILVTVRKPELLDTALLVFKTVRVGFPTAGIYVWGNGLLPEFVQPIGMAAQSVGAQFHNAAATSHDAFVEHLILNQAQPFWIADCDVVFFDEAEWFFDEEDTDVFAGRFEPTWREPWSQSIHLERLHTAVAWYNPTAVRGEMMRWNRHHVPSVFHTAQVPFIRQHFVPMRSGTLLYDTTAGLWQAGFGTKFTARQDAAWEHLHCGSYSDEVGKCEMLKDLPKVHQAICANPELARGIQTQQNEFYKLRAVEGAGISRLKRKVTA